MKQRWGLDRNVLQPTPGVPWGVEQHHWNTGAEENQQFNQQLKINNKTVNFVFAFIAFNNAFNNKKDNLTLLHMGEIFIS